MERSLTLGEFYLRERLRPLAEVIDAPLEHDPCGLVVERSGLGSGGIGRFDNASSGAGQWRHPAVESLHPTFDRPRNWTRLGRSRASSSSGLAWVASPSALFRVGKFPPWGRDSSNAIRLS